MLDLGDVEGEKVTDVRSDKVLKSLPEYVWSRRIVDISRVKVPPNDNATVFGLLRFRKLMKEPPVSIVDSILG